MITGVHGQIVRSNRFFYPAIKVEAILSRKIPVCISVTTDLGRKQTQPGRICFNQIFHDGMSGLKENASFKGFQENALSASDIRAGNANRAEIGVFTCRNANPLQVNANPRVVSPSRKLYIRNRNKDYSTEIQMQQQRNQMNILVADDETSTTTTISFVLKHAGHRVDVVHDGKEALEVLQKFPDEYQILITDHQMQTLSGLDLVEKLHQTKFRGRILVLSAYLTKALEASYQKHGVKQFINKPFDLEEIRNAVALTA